MQPHRSITSKRRYLRCGKTLAAAVLAILVGSCGGDDDSNPPAAEGISGNRELMRQEQDCIESYAANPANNYLNYWMAIGSPEHTDAIHSGTQPCATFTGSLSGENRVLQYTSQSTWESIQFIVFDGSEAGYLLGGAGASEAGAFVAKFDPSNGSQIWLTYLNYPQNPDQWNPFGSIGIIEDGSIVVAVGPMVYKLDRDTGDITNSAQATVRTSPNDANFDGFHVAPDSQGTILMKTQTRPVGCPIPDNSAIAECDQSVYGPLPNTTVDAIDPNTLETIDSILLDQVVVARPIVTTHNDQIYMYMAGNTTLLRVIWDPETQSLTQDASWQPTYLLPGQTGGPAPALLGDWVITSTNANPGTVPQSIVAIHQDDPIRLVRINPWGDTLPEGVLTSETPASVGVDPDNNMIYAQDWLVNGVYAISLDQATGDMEIVWSRPDWRTSDYFSLVGPANQRVVISQYLSPDFEFSDINGLTYTEGVLWADAATGETLAQSTLDNPSTAVGSLPNVGYGGRIYMMGNAGSIFIYKVEPMR